MRRAASTIFPGKASDWEDLEKKVCQIFVEMGCAAARKQSIRTVRGRVDVDVEIRDRTRRPHTLILCECKFWNRRVPKTVVHAFRTVVHDSGASLGFIISDAGFQAGAYEAAINANIKLVTWKQFQIELYERWLDAMWTRLTLMADALYELIDAGTESGSHPTLLSEAIKVGGEGAWKEFERLNRRYLQYSLASTHVMAGVFRKFPVPGVDPRAPTQKATTFKSARMYFDAMYEMAPQAFCDYATFLLKHTGGRCGSHEVFDENIMARMIEGRTTMNVARNLLGHRGWIKCVADGEVWTIRGSVSRFEMPAIGSGKIGKIITSRRTLTLNFGADQIARRISVEDSEYAGPPRP
ncbi:MAG: restriction endonuclease [Alphaproteobacteria bacterium]